MGCECNYKLIYIFSRFYFPVLIVKEICNANLMFLFMKKVLLSSLLTNCCKIIGSVEIMLVNPEETNKVAIQMNVLALAP